MAGNDQLPTRSGASLILNIIDQRQNIYRWERVDVIIEAAWHDNAIPGSDQAALDYRLPDFAGRKNVSLADAVIWASSFETALTLYLYDECSDAVSEWPASIEDLP